MFPMPRPIAPCFSAPSALAGETVLVHGATGGVGIASVQLARAAGMTVIGTGGTEEGRRLVTAQGAHHVLDHRAPDYLKQLMELTGGRGVDVILEMAAHVNLGKDLTVLAKAGRVASSAAAARWKSIRATPWAATPPFWACSFTTPPTRKWPAFIARIGAGLENGTLRPVVAREMPLAEAAQGHQAVMEPGALGKIVLVP